MRFKTLAQFVIAGFALLLATRAFADAASGIRSIDIIHESDTYKATMVMSAPVPLSVAWEVLTDFENMSGWVPNVRESKVVSRDQNVVVIEQRGVARFGLASFPYTSVRKMELDPQKTVKSTQVKGSMKRVESVMTLAPDSDGTRLTYELQLVPAGLAAAVVSKDFLAHELTEQFSAIIAEMKKRSH